MTASSFLLRETRPGQGVGEGRGDQTSTQILQDCYGLEKPHLVRGSGPQHTPHKRDSPERPDKVRRSGPKHPDSLHTRYAGLPSSRVTQTAPGLREQASTPRSQQTSCRTASTSQPRHTTPSQSEQASLHPAGLPPLHSPERPGLTRQSMLQYQGPSRHPAELSPLHGPDTPDLSRVNRPQRASYGTASWRDHTLPEGANLNTKVPVDILQNCLSFTAQADHAWPEGGDLNT